MVWRCLKFLELSNQLVFSQSQALAALAERGLLNLDDLSEEEAMGNERPGDTVPIPSWNDPRFAWAKAKRFFSELKAGDLGRALGAWEPWCDGPDGWFCFVSGLEGARYQLVELVDVVLSTKSQPQG